MNEKTLREYLGVWEHPHKSGNRISAYLIEKRTNNNFRQPSNIEFRWENTVDINNPDCIPIVLTYTAQEIFIRLLDLEESGWKKIEHFTSSVYFKELELKASYIRREVPIEPKTPRVNALLKWLRE